MTKVFQRPVGQFILSPSVVRAKDAMSIDVLFFSGLAELAINGLSHTKVRNDHAIMIQTRQRELAIVFNQAAVDRATSLLPCPLLALELPVLPEKGSGLKVCNFKQVFDVSVPLIDCGDPRIPLIVERGKA